MIVIAVVYDSKSHTLHERAEERQKVDAVRER